MYSQVDNFTRMSANHEVERLQSRHGSHHHDLSREQQIINLQLENQAIKQRLDQISENLNTFTNSFMGIDLPDNVGLLVTVDQGVIVAWNKPVWDHLGHQEGDLYSSIRTWRDLLDPTNSREAFGRLVDAIKNKRESYTSDFNMKHSTGILIPAKSTSYITYDPQTQFPLYSVTFIKFI
ncbi:efp [Acrasis kona]|uniref:Efp n=1 Tax=Acrasis kona TaxID=1008807 RepID=A0AAW2Z7C8_9EUKA